MGERGRSKERYRVTYQYDGSPDAWFEFHGTQGQLFRMMAASLKTAKVYNMRIECWSLRNPYKEQTP